MNTGFWIRPLQHEDTDAIVGLYDAASARDANIGPITHAQWTGFVRSPQNQDGRDFRVGFHDGRLAGLAESSLREQNGRSVRFFKLLVEPSMRRKGLGSALLQELLALNPMDNLLSFHSLAANQWTDGIAFLEAFGFSLIESELSMRCSSLAIPPSSPLANVSIDRVETPMIHAEDVARIHNAAFASDMAFRSYTGSETAKLLAEEGQEIWVIRHASRFLGYCRLEREPKITWIEEIAIEPSAQGQGLGIALADHVLRSIGVDRESPAGLNVSSVNQRAQSMYQRLGFAQPRPGQPSRLR